jgi:hypothetical protein
MKANLNLVITEDDGTEFFSSSAVFANLTRKNVLELEGAMLQFVQVLFDKGVKKSEGK